MTGSSSNYNADVIPVPLWTPTLLHILHKTCRIDGVGLGSTKKTLECIDMSEKIAMKQARYLALLLLSVAFLCMMGTSILKWKGGKVGYAQTTKRASEMFYPAVTMIPFYEEDNSLAKLSSYNTRKNLTEYYSKIGGGIKREIISIKQSYETRNG